jgi:hypothetical protein
MVDLAPGRRLRATVRLDPLAEPLLRDHQLNRYVVVPAVYYLEVAVEAARVLQPDCPPCELRAFCFSQVLTMVREPRTLIVEAVLAGDGCTHVRLLAQWERQIRLHAEGRVVHGPPAALGAAPPWPARPCQARASEDLYPHRFPNGPAFQVVERMELSANHRSRAALRVTESPRGGAILPVTLLDGAFQVDSATRSGFDRPSGLPHTLARLRWRHDAAASARVECLAVTPDARTESDGHLVFLDEARAVTLRLDGLSLTPAFSSLWQGRSQ